MVLHVSGTSTQPRSAVHHVLGMTRRILGGTLRGLAACWWVLLGLAAFSFTAHHLLVDVAARVAVHNGPAGMALLVLAITVRLVMIAVMVLVAARHITVNGRPLVAMDVAGFITGRDSSEERGEPTWRDYLDAFMIALVPLALLYAGWQLVNDDLHQFLVRLFGNTLAQPDMENDSNIDFNEGWKTYVPWAAGSWVLKVILEKLRDRTGRRAFDLPIVYTEVAWVVLTWLVLTSILGRIGKWWSSREVVHWWRESMDWLSAHLPLIDLPEVIDRVAATLGDLVSVLSFQLVMPMIWIAVAGLVLGWGLHESTIVKGSRLQESAERRWTGASNRNRYLLDLSTRELREKYLPLIAMLRLVWRSGLLPILAIATLYGIGSVLGAWVETGAGSLADPQGEISGMAIATVERCAHFLLEPIRVCFLVATFAEILRLRAAHVRRARARVIA